MEIGLQQTDIPIELECWMLKHGILLTEDMRALYGSQSDVAWPEEPEDLTLVSKGWKPSYDGEEPPF